MKFLLMLIIFSCSSMKPKNPGIEAGQTSGEKHPELKITALYEPEISYEDYHVLKIYFDNNSREWIRLKNFLVKDVKGQNEFHVIRENDLKAWKKSMLLKDSLIRDEYSKDKKTLPPLSSRTKLEQLDFTLYAEGAFVLPGHLQTERWLVLQLPHKAAKGSLVLELEFADSSVAQYEVLIGEGIIK